MFSSLAINRTALRRHPASFTVLILSMVMIAILAAGCGGDGDDEKSTILATVGNSEITSDYYEDRLSLLVDGELPVVDGVVQDTATDEGKLAFLEVLINKELLVKKALQLGYDQDSKVALARQSMLEYEGGLQMWNDVVGDISRQISEEELQAFYANMGTEYLCSYVICNFEDDAMEAREFALGGADWDDVVSEYHDGVTAPTGKYEIKVPFGQYSSEFEDLVYETEVGGVSMPITTSYGYWIVRVLSIDHNTKPNMEEAKGHILDVTQNRKKGRLRQNFKKEIRAKYNLNINEVALWATFQGLPETGMMDPATDQPYKREDLIPLDVSTEDLGEVLYSYTSKNDKLLEYTVADYKIIFDEMSVFQRPQKTAMLGGLRQKIIDEVERGLMNLETENRGYFENPLVLAKVEHKVEEIMVTRLYSEVVTFDDRITPEQLQEFWADHKSDYHVEESRSGHLVVCKDRENADLARKALMDGETWKKVLVKYGTDAQNKSQGGKTGQVFAKSKSPLVGAFFGLEMNDFSQPFHVGSDRYAVIQLEKIIAEHDYEMGEVSEALGGRMHKARQEAAFRLLLDEWKAEFGLEIFNKNLAGLKSWEELTARPDNITPIN